MRSLVPKLLAVAIVAVAALAANGVADSTPAERAFKVLRVHRHR